MSNEHDSSGSRINPPEVCLHGGTDKHAQGTCHLDTGRTSSDHDECQQFTTSVRVFFCLGQFKCLQDLVSRGYSIRKAFDARCKLFKLVMPEVAMCCTRGEDQVVIRDWNIASISVTYINTLLLLVDSVTSPMILQSILLVSRIPRIGVPI